MILAAEQCKKMLSQRDKAPMKFRYQGKMEMVEVSRATFEELTEEKMEMTMACVRNALRLAGDGVHIDDIILVGGSCRMPMVKKRLEKEFPSVNIRLDQFEPDLAIAKGAAIHAQNLSTPNDGRERVKIGSDKGSRSYGVSAYVDNVEMICNIVLRTDPMVLDRDDFYFTTRDDGQTGVTFSIYENASAEEHVDVKKGKLIKHGSIEWGHPVPAGTQIYYRVRRGKDGIVHIFVKCEGKEFATTIEPKQLLSESDMMKIIDEFEDISL